MRTRQLTALQTQLAEFQLQDPKRIEAARKNADIRARLYRSGQHPHRVELSA